VRLKIFKNLLKGVQPWQKKENYMPYQSGKASNHKAKQLNSQHSFRAS
jgi:hypothetical protein